ncbi:MAG: hypothetical protein HY611_05080, partial [Elusimicrobia bacterium]|nr:hypothetical protein [Elusimicrobiota bacterium]
MEALRKTVALALSFFLVWLSPGIGCYGVLAAAAAGYSTYYYDNDRKEYVEVGKVLPALLRRILDNPQVHWRPEEREKLIGAVRRLEAGMGAAPDERTKIINQVNNLARRLEKPEADSEHLLADFYSSVANFAKKTEEEWTASTNQTYTFADQTKTYFDRSYNAITGTWTRDRYVRPLSDELQQVVIYEPDPKKPEKKVVSTVARIFDDGMRQEQKVHYSRQYCSMLEDLNQAFKSRGDVPDLVVEYIGKCRDADKTGHYDRLSPEEFERVQTVAQKYYLDNELAQFEKARALSKVQYYVGKWNMPKNPLQKSADDELDVNSLSYEKIQQTLGDLEAGKIPTLSWFGRAIARYSRMRLPDELRRPLNRVQRYLDYALDAKERAFEPGISEEARSARIEEVEEWMKFAQQQFLIFQLGSMKENVQKLSQGQPVLKGTYRIFGQEIPSATSALDKFAAWLNREQKLTDPKDQVAAEDLAEQEQRLAAHLEEMEAKSRATLVKVTAASLGKSLWEARFGYLADEDVRKQVTLSRDRAEALRVLSERGDPHAARALASVIAQLDEARRKKDVSQARLAEIQRAWEGLPAVWASLGFSGMPDFEQTEKERLQMKVYQANLTYSADKMSLYMQSFASAHQFDMGGTEYLTSGNWIKSAQDWAGMPRGWWTPEKGVKQRFAEWSMQQWDEFRGKKSYRALKEIWPKHRQDILGAMRQGRYNDAMEKFIALDPGAADAALAKFRKTNSPAPRPTDIVGVLTQGISSETGVKLDGVAQKQFEHLSDAAKTYMFASAAFDMVTTAAAMYAAAPVVVRGMKTAATGARLVGIKAAGRAAASGRVAAALWRTVGFGADKAYRYFGGVGLDMANMANLTLPSRQMGAVAALQNAYQPVHFLNILKAYSLQTGIIGGASAVISAGTHGLSPETSPYKSGADAAIEGAAGGASWAAQWGWMFMLQPLKLNMLKPGSRLRTLFERGWSDLASQYAAKGGIWLSRRYLPEGLQVTGKTVAGRAMVASAEQGPVQALAGESMALQMPEGVLRSLQKGPIPLVGPVYRTLTGLASFGWGMIDGISRYMVAGVAAQNAFEAVGYGVSRAVERDAPGDSSHAGALARGQRWGQAAAEWSFLAVPTGVQGRSDWVAEAKNEGKILREIIRQNREGELFRMEEGDPLKVTVTDWLGRPTEIKGTFNSGMLAAVLDARASKEPGKILELYAQARSRGQDYEAIDIPVLPKPQTEAKPGGPGAKPAPS